MPRSAASTAARAWSAPPRATRPTTVTRVRRPDLVPFACLDPVAREEEPALYDPFRSARHRPQSTCVGTFADPPGAGTEAACTGLHAFAARSALCGSRRAAAARRRAAAGRPRPSRPAALRAPGRRSRSTASAAVTRSPTRAPRSRRRRSRREGPEPDRWVRRPAVPRRGRLGQRPGPRLSRPSEGRDVRRQGRAPAGRRLRYRHEPSTDKPAVDEVTYDGEPYGVPEFYDNRTLIVNDTVLRQAGVTDFGVADWPKLKADTEKLSRPRVARSPASASTRSCRVLPALGEGERSRPRERRRQVGAPRRPESGRGARSSPSPSSTSRRAGASSSRSATRGTSSARRTNMPAIRSAPSRWRTGTTTCSRRTRRR